MPHALSEKPLILSIETSATVCSAALHQGGTLIRLSEVFIDKSHSQVLVPMVQELLKSSGMNFRDLTAVAVSKGPGSYTGLRIGVSTAKGICYALDIPLIGIGTLEGLARQYPAKQEEKNLIICPMLDARRMEVYTLLCRTDGTVVEPAHAKIINAESFHDYLSSVILVFIGPGSGKCKAILENHPNSRVVTGYEPSAKTIGELALIRYLKGEFENTASFEPFYLKEFQTTVPKSRI